MSGSNYTPKLRLQPKLSGIVVSDVFPGRFQKREGDRFVDADEGYAYNVEIPVDGSVPVVIQLLTTMKPERGDEVEFKFPLETFLKQKYAIQTPIAIRKPGKRSTNSPVVGG